jgi:uncharacterized membrane protein YeaQ/YmgE (transglycosylase-associated protein family)
MLLLIVIGLLIGIGAMILMPERNPVGVMVAIFVGIAGSVVPGVLGRTVGWYGIGEPAGIIGSVLGAVLLLCVYRLVLAHESGSDDVQPAKPAHR